MSSMSRWWRRRSQAEGDGSARAERRYKRPESVLVVVYAHSGDVLLLERRQPPGFWQSVTGSLHWGEGVAAAARRELVEETGLIGQPQPTGRVRRFAIVPPWRERYPPGATTNLEHELRLPLDRPCAIRLAPNEHRAFGWLSLAVAIERVASWSNREALELLAGELGGGKR